MICHLNVNIMNLFSLHHATKDPKDQLDEDLITSNHELTHDMSEGSEFLDDAIRMRDQPLMYTEESIAAGSPPNLL
jgi:hypothetical protein